MKVWQQDWAAKWAVYSPDKIAFTEWESGRELTYAQLNQRGNRLAQALTTDYEIKKGDRIAILAENCLEYLVLFSAAQKTGCILVPLNYRLAAPEIDFLLQNADPKIIIGEDKFMEKLTATQQYQQAPFRWPLTELKHFLDLKAHPFDNTIFPLSPLVEDDPIFILYTSGTTGFPKGALYTHKMLFWNSINTSISLIINTESRTVNCMPPFHTGGWNVLMTPFLHHGASTYILKKFDAKTVLGILEKEQISLFMGVPTMLKMIADLPDFDLADLSKLIYIIVGGEPMPIPLIERWHKKGVPIRQGYGMTEVGPNLTSLHQDDAIRKKGAIGRPNFYVDIKIVDEHNNETPVNQAGELLLRGPMVTPGYWRNAEATAKAIKDNWFYSGDRVLMDEEGYLFVVDRIKNMFISGGENVYPAEVERVLLTHPAIAEAVVIGVPNEKWGEVGKAFLVCSGAPISSQDIQDFCREKLAKFKVPQEVVFLEALPKNDTGKIDRKALRC